MMKLGEKSIVGDRNNWETEKFFKEIGEKHASQNEPESAATVVRGCP
ncbi:MAG: hypothetical protein JGK05_24475 [Microcoleus sp. PH2017_02_FOX_O_A]|nr:hypothetical protein [Microcoleus sp. PH2017_02_FOX_O_A]